MDKPTVYVETSVVSYLTARPTADLLAAAWQKVMLDWWETRSSRFNLYTSEVTVQEAGTGNPKARATRLAALADIPLLPLTDMVDSLAMELIRNAAVPARALNDALHVAVAAVHGVDYLLTWNYRHLDNAETKPAIRETCGQHGYVAPEICTLGN